MFSLAIDWRCATMSGLPGLPKRCPKRRCKDRYASTGTWWRIGATFVTLPYSASKTGNKPLSLARRATFIVSFAADPHPRGHGTRMWRYLAPLNSIAFCTLFSRSCRAATVVVAFEHARQTAKTDVDGAAISSLGDDADVARTLDAHRGGDTGGHGRGV